jgi:CTP:molybdopterin cytidylyltransferase MocA
MEGKKIGAVIVAGGLSSRMKEFKPLLKIGNYTMIERVILNFMSMGIENIVVVTGYRGDDIEKKLSPYGISFVKNNQYETTHMFDSVCIGLNELANEVDMIFFTPADSPFVQKYTLEKMMDGMKSGNHSIIQPSFEGENGHPLLIKNEAISKIISHDGTMGLQGAINNMGYDCLNMNFVDPGIVMDADTPSDYIKLVEYSENMSCPSIELCLKIQDYFGLSDDIKSHSNKVAEIAMKICDNLNKKGINLNSKIVMAASLLHDIAKGKHGHADVGAHLLCDMGYTYVSQIVKEHMELSSCSEVLSEKEVVFLADKMVKSAKLVTVEERFSAKEKLYENNELVLQSIAKRKKQALNLYDEVFNSVSCDE